ncbi:MAG: AhpC/TSA family protein [Bacteroidales bacterium]|nr:AhpC/TSA family protein [Bacteroidales bacterium]
MKKIVYIIAGFVILSACTTKPGYQISGTIDGLTAGDVVLLEQRIDKEYVQIDSVTSPDGTFEFLGSVEIPDVYYVTVPGKRGKAMIFLENNLISFTAHADTLFRPVVDGSTVHDEYDDFQESNKDIYTKAREFYPQYSEAEKAGDDEAVKALKEEINAIYEEAREFQLQYLEDNPASFIAPFIVQSLHYGKDADEIEDLLAKLDPSLQGSSLVGSINRRVETLKKVAIGMPAPEFTQNDSTGTPVSLSSLSGNYLLIDFWAAWCAPCRGENPNVVAAYKKYHDRGFDILGVSLDNSREDWLKAVKTDQLTWTHVSDIKGWSNEVAALYGISSIPSNILLDPDGLIVKKNLRGDDLHAALKELLPE